MITFWGGDHFSFMNLWEQVTPGVVVANKNPRGIVGRVYIVNRYVLINTNHRSCRLHGLRRLFIKVILHYTVNLWKLKNLRVWLI